MSSVFHIIGFIRIKPSATYQKHCVIRYFCIVFKTIIFHYLKNTMSVIVVGSMAFDAIETPFGKVDKIVGGAATYIAYAAANFVKPVQQISIVGYDFPAEEMSELKSRGVQLDGVEV